MPTKRYFLIVVLTVLTILGSFYSGFFLKNSLSPNTNIDTNTNIVQQKYKPNFIDEIILVTKEKPYQALILTAIRTYSNENINNYTIKAFYFNGQKWLKEISEGKSKELDNIPKTPLIPIWEIINDPSYMLKQSSNGEVNIDEKSIKFEIPTFYNEMSIRSSPKYTKFMSETDGTLIIDDKEYDSYILYSRIYSFSPPEGLIFISDPAGIETEWLAFWDNNGNFYTIDETVVDNKKTLDTYKAHSLGMVKDKDGKVQKSFILNLERNGLKKYSVDIKENINKTIDITKLDSINKSVNGVDIWLTGLVEGEVKTKDGKSLKGLGVFEQISQ
ncbi:MAG: hypothetical protein AAB778_01935 [Patescibacteria group bacterium]